MTSTHIIPAGKLHWPIELQRSTETTDDAGAPVKTWTKLASVKAELVEMLSNDERMVDFGNRTREMALFRLRYVPGITLSDRVLFNNAAFRITKIAEIGIRRGLELTCERFPK